MHAFHPPRRFCGPFLHDLRQAIVIAMMLSGMLLQGGPQNVARGELIAGWDFQTTTNGGTAVVGSPNTPKVYVANFGTGTLHLNGQEGSSDWFVPASGSTNTELNGFGGSNINTAGTALSTVTTSPSALALLGGSSNAANGKAMVFKFTMTGYQDLMISLSAQRTSTGFTTQSWEYSTDGTTYTTFGSLVGGATAGTIQDTFANSGVLTLPTVTGFNNAANAYVRVTFTGATAANGNNRLDNIQFNATTYSPPAATLSWSGNGTDAGGAGTWSAAGSNWSASGTAPFAAWNTANRAVFGTTGGVVTIDAGGITADAGVEFEVDGYTLSGGTLTFGAASNQLAVATAATAIINAPLAGGAGLTKTSPGSLVLGGVNTFSGPVTVSAGTLRIATDAALGDVANHLIVNGTLQTTATLALGAGRNVTGSGTLDIAPGSTLTIAGDAGLTATTLANTGTLSLGGSTRSVGALTFTSAATVDGSGPIGIGGIDASAVTSGIATVSPGVAFTAGDQQVSIGTGGTLRLEGGITGSTGRMVKTGGGTLVVPGSSTASYRIGSTGSTPIDGGAVIIGQADSAGVSQIQLNYGTLQTNAAGGLTLANGVSMGGRSGAVAVFGGPGDLTFNGESSFFRGTGTSGELRVDVNNNTELAGAFAATSGGGTATGITFGGTGRLTLSGDAAALTETITLTNSLEFILDNAVGGNVAVGSTNMIGGGGTIGGTLTFALGAQLLFDPLKTLTVNGASVSFLDDFGIANLVGFSAAVADGTYTLIDGTATVNTLNLLNLGPGNAVDLGGGRSAYFETGSLVLQVVPEPSSLVLVGVGGLLAAGYAARRRWRKTVSQ